MSIQVGKLIQDVSQEINIVGQKVSQDDFYLFANRANKYFLTNYKMPTVERNAAFLVFGNVFEYPLFPDFTGFTELERPYNEYQPRFLHNTQKEIVHNLNGNKTAFKFEAENQFLIVNYNNQTIVGDYSNTVTDSPNCLTVMQINYCDSLTDNGTWTIAGDGSNLAIDKQYFTAGSGALRFQVTGNTGFTTLECTNMNPVDLTNFLTSGFNFLDFFNPNITPVTSIRFRIGKDASNYYEMSAATRYRGDSISQYYGQVGFDMSAKTTTGTPDISNITYIQVYINHGVVNGIFRMDNIFCSNPTYFNLPYYSKYNIKALDGTYKELVTSSDDTVLCPFEADEAITYKVAEFCAVLKMNDDAEANYFRQELMPKEAYLRSKYPSGEPRTDSVYYRQPNRF